MFKKLKNTFTFNDYQIYQNRIKYGRTTDNVFYGLAYDLIDYESNSNLFEVIPKRYQSYFNLLSMTINTHITPHTDSGILCTINFYIESQNAITKFYKIKSSNPELNKLENQTNGNIFDLADLEEQSNFVANNNEAFILDVTNPHSVTCTKYGTRKALVLQTREFSYDEVCKMLEETTNL